MTSPAPGLGSPVIFARVLQTAHEAGLDEASLRELQRRPSWPERCGVWARIMRAIRVDGFPIRVARRTSLADIGPLGTAAQAAPDLRSAFEQLARHQHVLTGAAAAEIRDDLASGTVVLERRRDEGSDVGGRCRREMMVAVGLQFAREISGRWIRPRRVHLAHAAPSDPSEHEAFFDCELRFGARFDGLEFDRETLATPLPGADPALAYFLLEHLHAIAGDPPPAAATLAGKVRQAICARLGSRTLAMAAVAPELGMSPRTLRRRLLEHRTSYHEILERVRRELADELLSDPDRKLSEVAILLGYSDASAFHRAYVRWTGRTPSARREKRSDP